MMHGQQNAVLVQIIGTDQRKPEGGSQQFIQHGQPITTYKLSEITKKDKKDPREISVKYKILVGIIILRSDLGS